MAQNNTQSDFIDIKGILKQYFKKWYYFVISIVIMGCLGFFVTKIVKPKYQVNANIVLSTTSGNGSMMASAMGMLGDFGSLLGASAEVEDEIFIITSHSVLKNVAKDLDMNLQHYVRTGFLQKEFKYDDFPVQIYPGPGIMDTLRTSINFKIKVNSKGKVSVKAKAKKNTIVDVKDQNFPLTLDTSYGKFVIDKTSFFVGDESLKTDIKVVGYGIVAEKLAEDITVDMASKRSNVIRLGYKTPYPIFGERVLNKVVELYNKRGVEFKNNQNSRTSNFLKERIAIAEADLNSAESNLVEFKEKNGIVNFESDAQYTYTLRGENESQLSKEMTRADILKSNLDFLSNPDNSFTMIPVLAGTGGASDAITTYNSLILQRMDLLRTVKPNNPILVKLDSQIDAMRENIVETLEKSYKNVLITVRDLQKNMAQSSSTLGKIPQKLNDYVSLSRNREIKQQIYLYLLKSLEETELAIAKSDPNAEIVDEAYTQFEPLGFSNKIWIVLFLFIGCCIPPVVIYLQGIYIEHKKKNQAITAA